MLYCYNNTRRYNFPDSFAKFSVCPVNKLSIGCQSIRPMKYAQCFIYVAIRHNSNNYLLGSGKLTGSPLIVFIITKAVYKTSLFKPYNFKLFVARDTLMAFILSHMLDNTLHFLAALTLDTTGHGCTFHALTPACAS